MKSLTVKLGKLSAILAMSTTALVTTSIAHAAAPVGIMVLHNEASQNELINAISGHLASSCSVKLVGKLMGAKGNFDAGSNQRFSLFQCGSSTLSSDSSRAALVSAIDHSGIGSIIEGPVVSTTLERATSEQEIEQRSYIVKLSFFNDEKQTERQAELARINAAANERQGGWVIDTAMLVNDAVGSLQPDAIDIIYYDTPEQRDAFREANPDVLLMAGTFNKQYLSAFTYFAAAVEPH